MDCRGFHDRLEEFLDGSVAPDERRVMDAHLRSCAGCAELVRIARAPAVEPPAELTRAVLRRTGASPCRRARDLLCDYRDGDLAEPDEELVRLHLRGCAECAALSAALVRLSEDLPTLAELPPDGRFAGDVLAATLPVRARLARRLARLAEGWTRLLQRPRIALESAYLGMVLAALLFGLRSSPLAGVPRRALDLARVNPVVELERPVARLEAHVASGAQSIWQATGRRAIVASQGAAVEAYRRIRSDAGTLWRRLASEDEDDREGRSKRDGDRPDGERT